MANIDEYIKQIQQAQYGEEVRGSIVNALKKVNDDNNSYVAIKKEVVAAKDIVEEKANAAKETLTALQVSTQIANEAKSSLNNIISSAISTQKELEQVVLETGEVIARVDNAKSNLDKSITSAGKAELNLQRQIETSNQIKNQLDVSNNTAIELKKNLDVAINEANTAKVKLVEAINNAGNAALEKIETAQSVATRAVETAKDAHVKAITTAGTTETKKVTDEGAKQVQTVQSMGTQETEKVTAEGTKQVTLVKTEGEKHLASVQTAAQEIIADREQINTNKEGVAQLKEEIEELKDNGTGSGTGLSTEAINKLDEIGNHIPFASATGGTLWDELIILLRSGSSGDDSGSGGDTTATPTSISATYTGGEVTTGTALSDLTGITVTATYSDGTTKTVTGYTLSGEILEGENTITVSYSGLTNTFTVTGIVESGGGDTTAELVTDGLVSYFDFRTCEYNNAGSGGSTLVQPTQGNGQLFTWSNNAVTEQSADYGVRVSRGFMYAENGGTNQSECGESFTWVFNSYLTSLSSPMFSTDYGALSNRKKINYEPRYNTSSSTQKVAKEGCGNRKENGYDLLFIVVDKNICKLYFGNELIKEIDGNTIEGFVSWYSKLLINILGGINSGYMSQLAIYNKALSDVEITEMQEYLKDLEVA